MTTDDLTIITPRPKPGTEGLLPLGTQIEGFEVRAVIGVGGFGAVYRAWDTQLQREVALKEYLPAQLATRTAQGMVMLQTGKCADTFEAGLRSFVNEARLLAQFDHPALVKVYRFWESNGTAYMVMPLYEGHTLKALARQDPQAQGGADAILAWLVPLTHALEVMHAQGCFHRDISPENILIQANTSKPILLDFGAARRTIGQASQSFTVILKTSYAPLEQYAEVPGLQQGPWTDVYALASVAYSLICGHPPPAAVGRSINDSYQPLAGQDRPGIPPHFAQAIDEALKVRPEARTQTMREFRDALCVQSAASGKVAAGDLPPIAKPEVPSKANHASFVVLSVAAVGLASLFGLAVWNWPSDSALPNNTSTQSQTEQTQPAPPSPEPLPTARKNVQEKGPVHRDLQALLDGQSQALGLQLDSAVLKIGHDLLQFTIESPEDGYASLLTYTSAGELLVLLPNARLPAIPVKAAVPLTLPPQQEPLQAAGPAGENQILVLVSPNAPTYNALPGEDYYGFKKLNPTQALTLPSWLCNACAYSAAWFVVSEIDEFRLE